jgi:glycosyltransferase involved in cell wall biosynthesis
MTAIYAIPTCQWKSIKLINGMVVNTPVQRNILNKHWLRAQITFPFSKMVIGNSKAGLEAYKAPKRKSLCIYNGMDLNRFNNLKDAALVNKEIFKNNIPPEAFIIGMVAAFEDRKDYNTLIRAAKQLISSNDNIYFILVGDGMNLNEIKKSVPERLLDKIVFLGKRSDIESIVNIFDVGILLTNRKVHGEGVSNSIIEYMALGKPVIATRGGGTNEVISDKVNGYLIDPDGDMQLIERIQTLMNDKCLRENLGTRAQKSARENFDLKIMTNNYTRLYYKLLENKNDIK